MRYNSVSTPVFYVSILQWLNSLGKLEVKLEHPYDDWGNPRQVATGQDIIGLVNINPSTQTGLSTTISGSQVLLVFRSTAGNFNEIMPNDNNFSMMLGHTFRGVQTNTTWSRVADDYLVGGINYNGFNIRYDANGGDAHDIEYDKIEMTIETEQHETGVEYKLGSFLYGTYFQMPHSPDLSLSLSYETGTKNIETKGGASLSNTMWRPPMWGGLGAWELSESTTSSHQTLAHSTRRIWDLSFSYLSQEDIFPKFNALNKLTDEEEAETVDANETLLSSEDFFSVVYNKVGNSLPFVFQPNKDEKDFAICKFVGNMKFTQTSPTLYSCKVRIRECW